MRHLLGPQERTQRAEKEATNEFTQSTSSSQPSKEAGKKRRSREAGGLTEPKTDADSYCNPKRKCCSHEQQLNAYTWSRWHLHLKDQMQMQVGA
jgi:hypothetical protein